MDVVVLAKFVPDINRIPPDAWDRERGTLVRARLEMAFNPLDRVALRMALDIRAQRPDTRIVALSMGPAQAMAMLKEAVACGADQAVLLTDRRLAGADTLATAYTVSSAIRSLADRGLISRDFAVLCGMQSPDGDTAQVPAQAACFLGAPLYPYVSDLSVDAERIEFKCLSSVGFQRVVTGRRPFVATVTRLYPELPFYVDLAAMQRANRTEVLVWGCDDIQLDPRRVGLDGSRTRVIRIFEPERRHGGGKPLVADRDGFADHAAAMLAELRGAFGRSDRSAETDARSDTPGTPGKGYYSGDCVALCEPAKVGLAPVSREMVSACARMARALGCRPVAVTAGAQEESVAEDLASCGAEEVWFIEGLDPAVLRVRDHANAVAALLRQLRPQIVIAPATLTGRVLAPYVSAQLDCGLTADCSALDVADFSRSGRVFPKVLYQTRPALGGNIMATIVSVYEDLGGWRPQMATVRPGALPVGGRPAEACRVHAFRAPASDDWDDRITLERQLADEQQIDLEDFEVIVAVGMGVGDRETIGRVVEPFRAALERLFGVSVGLGCSRAMVDAGVLPHSHQVGQTGLVVKPKIYIGLGVSGAIQHKIGMENSRLIVSVNRDPSAPIHGFADHAVVGDVQQVLPLLTRLAADAP